MTARPLDFLLEIGCEEIPARMIGGAVADLAERTAGILEGVGLSHGEARTFSTPRRLAVLVPNVAPKQDDRDEEILGPPAKAAFGPDGSPTKAAIGFAQKMGIEVAALERVPTPKGEYLAVRRRAIGRSASEILAEGVPRAVAAMTFPKTMRWGDGVRRFVRPVHWVLALLGTEVVPFELFGVPSGRETAGHRILGARRVRIGSPAEYEPTLLAQGIVVDRGRRREALAGKLRQMALDAIRSRGSVAGEGTGPGEGTGSGEGPGSDEGTGGREVSGAGDRPARGNVPGGGVRLVEDEALLEEVADLVEHPGAVLGSFPREFLSLPREVLVTTLRHHQKAFSTEGPSGLGNFFLVVADTDRDPEGHVRKGNEWVVVGRLEDARFFWQEDRKTPLAARCEKLEQVTFHAKAGTYAAKSRRVEEIGAALAQTVNEAWAASARARDGKDAHEAAARAVDPEIVREAAHLAKCDLVTGLVGEFPELQGIAGGLYLGAEARSSTPPAAGGFPSRSADGGREGAAGPGAAASAAPTGSAAASGGPDPLGGAGSGAGGRDLRRVADAIYDQYRPNGARDALPRTGEGSILALADRLDTLGALARTIGLPTGSRDPFGVRRAAAGVIRIAAETPLPVSLWTMATITGATLDRAGLGTPDGARDGDWLVFLRERLQFWLKSKGAEYDSSNAVLLAAKGQRADHETVPRLAEKVFALERLREQPELGALVEIHKRCRNILEQAESAPAAPERAKPVKADPEEASAFEALAGQVLTAEKAVSRAMGADEFEPALQHLVQLRPALSHFFDHVLVMHPDPELRRQRLGLVRRIAGMIEEVADLKQLAVSKDELRAMATGSNVSP